MAIDTRDAVLSFYRVRQALGWLGLALPVVLIATTLAMGRPLPAALSDFYYTPLRDVFVGIMVALGVFLLSYLGHREQNALLSDRNVSLVAGIGAIGIALFPNTTFDPCMVPKLPPVTLIGALHVISAGLFLSSTAVFCLVLFRRTDQSPPDEGKRRRNRMYVACGLAIVGALLGLAVYFILLTPTERCAIRGLRPVLWLEVVTVVAFGVSWLVKGRVIRTLSQKDVAPAQ